MKRLPSITLKAKLMITFVFMIAAFSITAWLNYGQLIRIQEQHTQQLNVWNKKNKAMELKQSVQQLSVIHSGYAIMQDHNMIAVYEKEADRFTALAEEVAGYASNAEQRQLRAKIRTVTPEYIRNFERAVDIVQKRGSEEDLTNRLKTGYTMSQAHMNYLFDIIDQFLVEFDNEAAAVEQQAEIILSEAALLSVLTAIGIVLITILFGFSLTQAFSRPLRALQSAVQRLSDGDFSQYIRSNRRDELGQLSGNFDIMVTRIRSMIGQSRTIASSLSEHADAFQEFSYSTATANQNIIKAISEISAGSEFQAAEADTSSQWIHQLDRDIQEISVITESMCHQSEIVKNNTQSGAQHIQRLQESKDFTSRTMSEAAAAMRHLMDHSRQIASIARTIKELADQTHILALNASIEAARAGSQGKGFAVIAERVRSLSGESGSSAKSIAATLHMWQEQLGHVESSLSQAMLSFNDQEEKVTHTISSFHSIALSMDELAEQMTTIRQKTVQAKDRNQQIVHAVQQVASIAEETAAGVQEVYASSQQQDEAIRRIADQSSHMYELSQQLFAAIARFQVGQEGRIEAAQLDEVLEATGLYESTERMSNPQDVQLEASLLEQGDSSNEIASIEQSARPIGENSGKDDIGREESEIEELNVEEEAAEENAEEENVAEEKEKEAIPV